MGKVIIILAVLGIIVGGVVFYKKNEHEIADYKQRKACQSEAERIAKTYQGKVDERIQAMAYERCLKAHNLQ